MRVHQVALGLVQSSEVRPVLGSDLDWRDERSFPPCIGASAPREGA